MQIFFKNKKLINSGGYALVETIFYIAILGILSTAVISALVTMGKTFKETVAQTALLQSSSIMERMSREVRQDYSATLVSSTDLILKDSAGVNKTEFKLSGTDLQLLEGSGLTFTGNLNSPNVTVTALSFTQITTTQGKAFKVVMSVRYTLGSVVRTADFYDTVTLRGSYVH
ncbi:MAG: hypothetical protein V4439_01750 [Patescibacteria group bacterium]